MTKANNGSGNNEKRDDWETPQVMWNKLDNQYTFTFDCCASEDNKKTDLFEKDFLKVKRLGEMSWINPPFSKADKMIKHFFQVVEKGVGIYRIDNIESKLWHFIMNNADWIFIPKGRIAYEHDERKQQSPRFGSALFGIGVKMPKNIEGTCLFVKNAKTEER